MKKFILLFFTLIIFDYLCSADHHLIHHLKYYSDDSLSGIWITKANGSVLLKKESRILHFSKTASSKNTISIDEKKKFQTIDGFGFTLTGGSAYHLYQLSSQKRKDLLLELFGNDERSISISYLRISIGASDLDEKVFSYDDLPEGQKDPELFHFSIKPDSNYLIPLLKEILSINPYIKIMGSPWSPPVWMKTNGNSKGGSLLKEYYSTYALYFVKYIQQMKSNGIIIDAITPQNEPLHPGNNPSMFMSASEQTEFIKNHLGPAFSANGIHTKIIVYDHNCNKPEYPISILNDDLARKFIDGSAFHLYEGEIKALSAVHEAHPDKNLYFTEQWTGSKGEFKGDLFWHMKNVIIGSMRNWGKIALEWNLANDANYGPHTPGGCTECKGALTIDDFINRNVSYYIIAHASKFIPPGSVRIESNSAEGLDNVAFVTPQGKIVLIVVNEKNSDKEFNIKLKGKTAVCKIPSESVATFIW